MKDEGCRRNPSSFILHPSSPRQGGPMSITLTVDGQLVIVPEGATVLDAVNRLGVPLPQLCKDPDRAPLGACRTCLVQVEGQRGFPASCSTPARDGMVVSTQSDDAVRIRRGVLDLTLGMLPAAAGFRGQGAGGRKDAELPLIPGP